MQLATTQYFCTKTRLYSTGVWSGFREEIPASDSLHLIIDGSNYLFIHLSSPLLSFPLSAWSTFWAGKRGQLGGKRDEARQVRPCFRWRRREVIFLYPVRTGATHSKCPQETCCRQATVFLSCCDTVSSSLVISGSRCLRWQQSYNERVWLQQGDMLHVRNQSTDVMTRQADRVELNSEIRCQCGNMLGF